LRTDKIEFPAGLGETRERYFAKSAGAKFSARDTGGVTEIELYDEVGFYGTSAKAFREKLRGAGEVVLRINSPGGSVPDGLAIYNDLVAHDGKVTVEITGFAASIASLIAMAGDEIAIAENAFLMVHESWTGTIGNRRRHAEVVEILKKIDAALVKTYCGKTLIQEPQMRKMLADETWLSGKEAVDLKFANRLLEAPASVSARFDLSVFTNTPAALAAGFDADEGGKDINTIRELEVILRDAGISRSKAKALAAQGYRGTAEEQRDAAAMVALADFIANSKIH
jgi:ATP-dependent Clp protease, protease subunit